MKYLLVLFFICTSGCLTTRIGPVFKHRIKQHFELCTKLCKEDSQILDPKWKAIIKSQNLSIRSKTIEISPKGDSYLFECTCGAFRE